jgi:hypothetical protein
VYSEKLTSTLRDGNARLRARVLLCRCAESSASRTRSRSSSSSRNWASRSASISVKIMSRTSARDKRFKSRLIFTPKSHFKEKTTQDSLWIARNLTCQQDNTEFAQSQITKLPRDKSRRASLDPAAPPGGRPVERRARGSNPHPWPPRVREGPLDPAPKMCEWNKRYRSALGVKKIGRDLVERITHCPKCGKRTGPGHHLVRPHRPPMHKL